MASQKAFEGQLSTVWRAKDLYSISKLLANGKKHMDVQGAVWQLVLTPVNRFAADYSGSNRLRSIFSP